MSDAVSKFVMNVERAIKDHVKTMISDLLTELHDRIDNPPAAAVDPAPDASGDAN